MDCKKNKVISQKGPWAGEKETKGTCWYLVPGHGHHACWEDESLVIQSCPTLCKLMACSLPGFAVYGLLQARIPEWIARLFWRGSSWPRDQTCVSCIVDGFFTIWATREVQACHKGLYFILAAIPWGFVYIKLFRLNSNSMRHIIDEETGAQRDSLIWPKKNSKRKVLILSLSLCLVDRLSLAHIQSHEEPHFKTEWSHTT